MITAELVGGPDEGFQFKLPSSVTKVSLDCEDGTYLEYKDRVPGELIKLYWVETSEDGHG